MTDRELDQGGLTAALRAWPLDEDLLVRESMEKTIRAYLDNGGEQAIRASERARLKEKLESEEAAKIGQEAVWRAMPMRFLRDEDYAEPGAKSDAELMAFEVARAVLTAIIPVIGAGVQGSPGGLSRAGLIEKLEALTIEGGERCPHPAQRWLVGWDECLAAVVRLLEDENR